MGRTSTVPAEQAQVTKHETEFGQMMANLKAAMDPLKVRKDAGKAVLGQVSASATLASDSLLIHISE